MSIENAKKDDLQEEEVEKDDRSSTFVFRAKFASVSSLDFCSGAFGYCNDGYIS